MKTTKNKTLKAAFMAVALMTGVGALPVPGVVQDVEASAASRRAAAKRRHDREAINAVLVSPTRQNVEKIADRAIISSYQVGYVTEAVKQMNVRPGTQADDISEETRDRFVNKIEQMHELDIVGSSSVSEAERKGLERSLAKYFDQCTKGLRPVDQMEAADAMACMRNQRWEKDRKPLFAMIGLGVFGFGVGGWGFSRLARRY